MAKINNGDRASAFTRDSARRIQRVVQIVEHGERSQPATRLKRMAGEDGDPVKLGKTISAWDKGTIATIDLYPDGTPPDETASGTLADCVNKFADVAADSWVMVARAGNGRWYLISAECDASPGSSP